MTTFAVEKMAFMARTSYPAAVKKDKLKSHEQTCKSVTDEAVRRNRIMGGDLPEVLKVSSFRSAPS